MKSDHNFRTPFIIGFDGTQLDSELEAHLLELNPLGVILFKRNIQSIEQVSGLIADLKELLGSIIVAVDHEGGVVNRFPEDCPIPPSPSALKQADSESLIVEACKIQSELLSHLGFNLNFVPVADLAVDAENHVIGTRSFSADPKEVARYGEICIRQHEAVNIATTAKHFPGHGRTSVDSHFTTGRIDHGSQQEFEMDIEPFQTLIKSGVPVIMTAHLKYSIIDKSIAASLSPLILQQLLRDQLRFSGIVISDCIEMAGLAADFTAERMVKKGLDAGLDCFISSFSIKKSRGFQLRMKQAYCDYLQSTPEKLAPSIKRIESFQNRYANPVERPCDMPSVNDAIGIHRKTLEKRRSADLDPQVRKLLLIDLESRSYEGINADADLNRVSRIIEKECPAISKRIIIHQYDLNELQRWVDWCNQNEHSAVLLSYNGYRNEKFKQFMGLFQKSASAIHIAMLDTRDLQNGVANEWATRGFNAFTGKALADELLSLANQ